MRRSMFLVVAGLVSVAVAANGFAQRPQPKNSPPKKGPVKGIQPIQPKGTNPKGPVIVNPRPVNPLPVITNTPSFGTGPRLVTPPVISGVTGYLGGGFNPALVSPLNPFSPVNNPWNFIAPNPWLTPPLNPWSTPLTPWINPWTYGPNFIPSVNPFNPLVNPFNPLISPVNPLNPWNNNPWAFNPVNNFGPQFAFPNNNAFAPFGPGANFLR